MNAVLHDVNQSGLRWAFNDIEVAEACAQGDVAVRIAKSGRPYRRWWPWRRRTS